jgi:hypothetical protein
VCDFRIRFILSSNLVHLALVAALAKIMVFVRVVILLAMQSEDDC